MYIKFLGSCRSCMNWFVIKRFFPMIGAMNCTENCIYCGSPLALKSWDEKSNH